MRYVCSVTPPLSSAGDFNCIKGMRALQTQFSFKLSLFFTMKQALRGVWNGILTVHIDLVFALMSLQSGVRPCGQK